MKSNHVHTQYNLKGKKIYRGHCGCCVTEDFREEYEKSLAIKEIQEYNINTKE